MTLNRQALEARLTTLLDHSLSLRLHAPLTAGQPSVDTATVTGILDLFAETASLLDNLGTCYEEELERHKANGSTPRNDSPYRQERCADIADLAFMGSFEIHGLHSDLKSALEGSKTWKTVSCARAGLGRVRSALIPIQSAIRDYEGLPAVRQRWDNLATSLEVRRRYSILWRSVRMVKPSTPESIRHELRMSKRRIEILQRSRIFPSLRIEDQSAFGALDERIAAYLEGDSGEDGEELWQAVVAFFGLLRLVNKRQELHEHDLMLVGDALEDLRETTEESKVSWEMLQRLQPLLGRDEQLDRLLLSSERSMIDDYLGVLERLKKELQKAARADGSDHREVGRDRAGGRE